MINFLSSQIPSSHNYNNGIFIALQLLIHIQRWARAYRDQTFHNCINTNNGTEALNKALKYTYLPRAKRSTNLSGYFFASIEAETFVRQF